MAPGPAPLPLPPEIGSLFAARRAVDAGLTEKRLRARDLDATVWGIRATLAIETLIERCQAFAERMPRTAFFSHSTAALLHGAPLPLSIARDERLDIALPAPHRGPHATGIRGHRLELEPDDVVLRFGLRVASPVRTFIDVAMRLGVPDLVAVGDFLIHPPYPATTRAELAARIDRHPPHLAGLRLRAALALLSERAESRPESLLRVLFAEAGLPMPSINQELVDAETGKEVRTDFAWIRHKVIVEYQGDYHRSKEQWRRDMRRRSALEAQGWTVIEANWDDIVDPAALLSRLRRALSVAVE